MKGVILCTGTKETSDSFFISVFDRERPLSILSEVLFTPAASRCMGGGEGSIGDRWRGCMLPGCQAAVSTSTGRVKMSCSRDIAQKSITLARNIPIPYTYLATAGNCRSLSSWCRQNISPRVFSGISRRLCAAIMSHSAVCQVSQCAAVPSLLVILANIHYSEAACQHASCLPASISVPGKWYLAAPIIFVHVVGNVEIEVEDIMLEPSKNFRHVNHRIVSQDFFWGSSSNTRPLLPIFIATTKIRHNWRLYR